MAAKRFHIENPDQLRELAAFVKEGKLSTIASVWTAAKRRNGTTRWDDKIFVGFSGDRNRISEVVRIDANSELVYCATLRYNLALNWCEKNLLEVYD